MKSCSTTNAVFLACKMNLQQDNSVVTAGGSGQRSSSQLAYLPFDHLGCVQTLLGVQIGRRFINEINVCRLAPTQHADKKRTMKKSKWEMVGKQERKS